VIHPCHTVSLQVMSDTWPALRLLELLKEDCECALITRNASDLSSDLILYKL
jgi:hypothetical protein